MKEQTKRTQYYYETFEDFFRASASGMWDEKNWDNETIKTWMRIAFEDARIKDYAVEFEYGRAIESKKAVDPNNLPQF